MRRAASLKIDHVTKRFGGVIALNDVSFDVTQGEISEQSDLVKALFDFIYSDEGSELVKSVGLITADK